MNNLSDFSYTNAQKLRHCGLDPQSKVQVNGVFV